MRTEQDSMGPMDVPNDALYGASTARAMANFPIARRPLPVAVIHAFGHLKAACAQVNVDLNLLDPSLGASVVAAADAVADGLHDDQFPVDVYQTGSGTSTNMNANEVIANLANHKLGFGVGVKGHPHAVHPNDHVNMGQSSNDTFPTAMHVAGAAALSDLRARLHMLATDLEEKARLWDGQVKIGRTHLMDATPIRVGQVFSGYANQARRAHARAGEALEELTGNLPIGGTAVGTGINTHPDFAEHVCRYLTQRVPLEHAFQEAPNHPAAQAAKDAFVAAHGHLKTIAVSLSKIANDIRLLGSGPRCGLGELNLPAIQPGSSIMPGKVNPVICESVMQVVCRVLGNDTTVTAAGLGGVGSLFELNVAMPVMIDAFLESATLLSNVSEVFVDKLLGGLTVNAARCRELMDQSLMMGTSLAPVIGYDNAAALAKQAFVEGKTIREMATTKISAGEYDLSVEQLGALLDPDAMTRPTSR